MAKRNVKKAIAIVGEGITEWMYFDYIRRNRRYAFSLKPDLPKHSDYSYIFQKAKELIQKGYDIVFCVLDLDAMQKEGRLSDFSRACKMLPKTIRPITSNPCIEIWFLMHYMRSPRNRYYESYEALSIDLQKHLPEYEKSRDYFESSGVFSSMEANGKQEKAIQHAITIMESFRKHHDVSRCSFSELYLVLQQLEQCKQCKMNKQCLTCLEQVQVIFS
jgi:hypothetical protein